MKKELKRIDEMLMNGVVSPEQAQVLKKAVIESENRKEEILEKIEVITKVKREYNPLNWKLLLIVGLFSSVLYWVCVGKEVVMDRALVFSILVLGVFVLLGWSLFFVMVKNRLILLDEEVKEAWAKVLALYQQKIDLIDNALSIAKEHAQVEKSLFETVAKLRTMVGNVQGVDIDVLDMDISKLMAVVEAYPDTDFGKDFTDIILQVKEVENMLASARIDYNKAVKKYRVYAKAFPCNIVTQGNVSAVYYEV